MVEGISHDIISLLVNNNATWISELSVTLSLGAKLMKKSSLLIKDLNATVPGVSHHDLVVPLVDNHTTRLRKLPISISIGPKLQQKLAMSIKHLNTMVASVSDNNLTPHIARHR